MKNILLLTITLLTVLFSGCAQKNQEYDLNIVSVNYIGYDFAKQITNGEANIELLIKPGSETHAYDPTAKDIIAIKEADVFIYTGGHSEEWVIDILSTIDNPNLKVIRLMDIVEVLEEEIVEGMQTEEHDHDHEHKEEVEYDEHVWTSPSNAIKILNTIKNTLVEIKPDEKETYLTNATLYQQKIENAKTEIQEIVNKATNKTLIFGDRFPFRYFVEEFNLDYYAAFPGCSSDTEASAKTIAYLINKVKKEKINVILKIELSSSTIADTIANETEAKVLELHSAHNISADDFKNNISYVDLLKRNLETLKEALQ